MRTSKIETAAAREDALTAAHHARDGGVVMQPVQRVRVHAPAAPAPAHGTPETSRPAAHSAWRGSAKPDAHCSETPAIDLTAIRRAGSETFAMTPRPRDDRPTRRARARSPSDPPCRGIRDGVSGDGDVFVEVPTTASRSRRRGGGVFLDARRWRRGAPRPATPRGRSTRFRRATMSRVASSSMSPRVCTTTRTYSPGTAVRRSDREMIGDRPRPGMRRTRP